MDSKITIEMQIIGWHLSHSYVYLDVHCDTYASGVSSIEEGNFNDNLCIYIWPDDLEKETQ